MKTLCRLLLAPIAVLALHHTAYPADDPAALPYCIVDTGQIRCYNDRTEIGYPKSDAAFFGQDAQFDGNQPAYRDHGNGTVTDLNTGLMWQSDPGAKKSYAQAVAAASACRTGGYTDWRLPTVKELYSLILFSGTDPEPTSTDTSRQRPFIDTQHFKFRYGQPADGDRIIDSQWATATLYVGRVMNGRQAMFGVNFADGRIKGYPVGFDPRGGQKGFYVIYVRGNRNYGKNDFVDNGDGTITDRATGLTWMQVDSGTLKAGPRRDGELNWQEALAWAESLNYAGRGDWRLPNAKELHSLVDYTRSPDTTRSAAIDPIFQATPITNEGGQLDFGQYWSSTTHARVGSADAAVYIAFGRALGFMSTPAVPNGQATLMDVHGAGAQRCDPKSGDPAAYPVGHGPQGDVIRINNLVRCVCDGTATPRTVGPRVEMRYRLQDGPAQGGPPQDAPGMRGAGLPQGLPGMRGAGPPSGTQWVQRLDQDGDGKVSPSEFDGPSDRFGQFDQNHDGYIDSTEAPTGPPPG